MTRDILDTVAFDDDGFMEDAAAWTEEIAQAIGEALEVNLSDRHWEVIKFARQEFETQGNPPTLRRITQLPPILQDLKNRPAVSRKRR